MRRSSLQLTGALLALLLASSGCKLIDAITGSLDVVTQELVDADDILTRAIADVNANAANWERILDKALADLPTAERVVREDLEQLSQRAIAGAGLEVRCDITFMRDMLVHGLQEILSKLKHEPPPPRIAVICNASPSVIDMNLPDANRASLEVYGYNLNQGGVQLLHLMKDGERDVTSHFHAISEFKRVINLGAGGVAVVPTSTKLRIVLGTGGGASEIPVIQKWPEVCRVRQPTIPSATLEVIPRRTGGDAEFDGHGPCIRTNARLSISPDRTKLMGNLFARIWECPDDLSRIKWDYSDSSGSSERVVYTTDPGYELSEIRSPTFASREFIDSSHDQDDQKDAGLVINWITLGDTDGDDIGKSFVRATLGPPNVVVKQTGDCVTEAELARLKQEAAMSAELQAWVQTNAPGVTQAAAAEQARWDARLAAVAARKSDPALLRPRERLQGLVKAFEARNRIAAPIPCKTGCALELDDRLLSVKSPAVGATSVGPTPPGPLLENPTGGPGKVGPMVHPSGLDGPHGAAPGGMAPGTLVTPGLNK